MVSADGELLGSARGGPFRPHLVGADAAVAAICTAGRGRRSRDAGSVRASATSPPAWPTPTCRSSTRRSRRPSRRPGWAPSCEVVNDTFALLRAGLDESRGVAVICGAGINCTGVLPDGTTVRFAAVGHISGDWGGGGHLWQEAMWWAARAEDGRGPDTALRTALPRHLGLDSMAALIEAVHLGHLPEERCLELTPLLFEVADAGDRVAARRRTPPGRGGGRAGRHRDPPARASLDEPIDVVLGGGVLTAGHQGLMDEIARRLAEEAPKAVARVVEAPPILGAALLGLDRIGATRGAQERLREEFRAMRGEPQRTSNP